MSQNLILNGKLIRSCSLSSRLYSTAVKIPGVQPIKFERYADTADPVVARRYVRELRGVRVKEGKKSKDLRDPKYFGFDEQMDDENEFRTVYWLGIMGLSAYIACMQTFYRPEYEALDEDEVKDEWKDTIPMLAPHKDDRYEL